MSKGAIRSYRDLLVWQKAIELVKDVYVLTREFPDSEKFGLTNQLRRAVVSVPSNIAEGQARQHTKEFKQLLYVARGSLAEVDTQLTIAAELGFADGGAETRVRERLDEVRRMLNGLAAKLPRSR